MLYTDGNRLMNQADKFNRGFERKKTAKLGTEKNPASVVVQTEERFRKWRLFSAKTAGLWILS